MSSVKFEPVLSKSPELRSTAEALGAWLHAHENQPVIEPGLLYQEIGHQVTPENLVRVLAHLVAANELRVMFRVALPDGTLSEDEFANPKDVPPVVFDSSFEPVEVTRDKIVPVYRQLGEHER